ncbi:MAG TPA: serine hydrolase domain-containing protein [Candidatus Eisenbacteria bacterium]
MAGFDGLDVMLERVVRETDFSGVIEIREGDVVRFARAWGHAERERGIPITLDTRFGIASGTKFLTALAIGHLIAEGRIELDTRLSEVLALDLPDYPPDITIRHLLTHTSGIPDYYDEDKVESFDTFALPIPFDRLLGPRDYLPFFPREPMKFAPGSAFSYSNGGYILLGVIVEELSGMGYQTYVARTILEPLGMSRSGFFAMDQLPEGTAIGYVAQPEGGWRTNFGILPIIGASDGGMFLTPGDLNRLWTAFWSGAILPASLVEIYATPHVRAAADSARWYGHGLWMRERAPGEWEHWLEGCDAGVSFQSIALRSTHQRITVMSNTTDGAWPILRAMGR